jgi:hypothetical protein
MSLQRTVKKKKNRPLRDLYRGINDFKRGHRSRNNLVKDEDGDLFADSHNIMNRWTNYFCQLLSALSVNDVRQIEIQTVEPLLPDPSLFEVETATAKLKMYKSPGRIFVMLRLRYGSQNDSWDARCNRLRIAELWRIGMGTTIISPSQYPRGLCHEFSSLAGTLGSWVRIPLKAWIFVRVHSVFVLFRVQLAALQWADPSSKEFYRLCIGLRN